MAVKLTPDKILSNVNLTTGDVDFILAAIRKKKKVYDFDATDEEFLRRYKMTKAKAKAEQELGDLRVRIYQGIFTTDRNA